MTSTSSSSPVTARVILCLAASVAGCVHARTAKPAAAGPVDLTVEAPLTDDAVPLSRVETTTSLEGEIGDGGFDTVLSAGSGSYFFPDPLPACGTAFGTWVQSWASAHQLRLLLVADGEDRHVVHVAAPDAAGFFRFYYSWRDGGKRAAGVISFHGRDGSVSELEPQRYPGLELHALPAQLLEVMRCE